MYSEVLEVYSQQTQNILNNICIPSAQRLRRWSNIVQMLYKWFVFAGLYWCIVCCPDQACAKVAITCS